ncbi:hypothetical protein [Pantoea ananatis]|uniref:hypothetical protein n=1 Tax=Pantoea ananas TaxID=553 RepID=UPI0011174783|nr:hypothetical protein [Pantoea ananatis]
MKHATEKLLSICSGQISDSYADINLSFSDVVSVFNELHELLKIKNGFYGFESALHVYPSKSIGSEIGLIEWNKKIFGLIHMRTLLWIVFFLQRICLVDSFV